MRGVGEVGEGAGGHQADREEAQELRPGDQLALPAVEQRQQLVLGHGLRVGQPPEVGDHPHRGGPQHLVLGLQHRRPVHPLAAEDVRLEQDVVAEHEVVPEEGGEQELETHGEHHDARLPVFGPDEWKTTPGELAGDIRHREVLVV